MLRDVGIQVLTPAPSSTPRQPDGSRPNAHLLAIVQRSSSDTQIPSGLLHGQQLLPFWVLPEVTHDWPIMTNILHSRTIVWARLGLTVAIWS